MFLHDITINYLAVFLAAFIYFIIGSIWYAPFLFGSQRTSAGRDVDRHKSLRYKISAYLGEGILSLIIAYVLAIFIQMSQADNFIEGVIVAFWLWLGFIATTHFSAVLWGRKTVQHFFVHACFMLIGLVSMARIILSF